MAKQTTWLEYRSSSHISTTRLVFTGVDSRAVAGALQSVLIDFDPEDLQARYEFARSLRQWCERVETECSNAWAAQDQAALFAAPENVRWMPPQP